MRYWIVVLVVIVYGCGAKEDTIATQMVEEEIATEVVKEESSMLEELPSGSLVELSTSEGKMTILLYDETPGHRDNFLKLVDEGFFDSLLFHRVIKNFMIQGGDPESKFAKPESRLGSGGPGYTIPAEFNPKFVHKKGALAAARTGGAKNPEKRSSGSQFYVVQGKIQSAAALAGVESRIKQKITDFVYTEAQKIAYTTIGGTPGLDMDYTVFGEVVEGLEVVDAIASKPTAPGDRPVKDVKMSMNRVK